MSYEWPEGATAILLAGRRRGAQSIEIVKDLRAAGYGFSRSAVAGKLARLAHAEDEEIAGAALTAEPWNPSRDEKPSWLRLNIQAQRDIAHPLSRR